MAPQSIPLPLLLTRPAAQGDRFAAELAAHLPGRFIPIATPLMEPVFLAPDGTDAPSSAVILTSETGVEAAASLRRAGHALPERAWCVGDRTAQVAQAAGFSAISAKGDAEALIALILASQDPGPFLHLRGREARGDIAPRLTAQGCPTRSLVVYAQEPRPLAARATTALSGKGPVVVPLFSPRSAALFAEQGPFAAPLWVAAISPATARAAEPLSPARLVTAGHPDGAAMLAAVETLLNDPAS